MKYSLLTIFIVIFGVSDAWAQYGQKATYRFLNVPVSALAASHGGVPVSVIQADPSQMHLNPAFLDSSSSGKVSISMARIMSESNMGFISGAWHHPIIGTLGAGLRFVNYGEMDHIDEYGIDRGTISATDVAFKLAVSRSFEDVIQYALAADIIHSSYDMYQSTGIGFSGGILYKADEQDFSVGLSFVNLGRQLSSYDGIRENLPFDLRLGVTRKLMYLPLRLTFTAHHLHQWEMMSPGDDSKPAFFTNLARHLAVGGEFLFSESFRFRIGYNHYLHEELKTDRRLDLVGFGVGVAIRYKGIGVEFGRNSYSNMGSLLQLGINTRL